MDAEDSESMPSRCPAATHDGRPPAPHSNWPMPCVLGAGHLLAMSFGRCRYRSTRGNRKCRLNWSPSTLVTAASGLRGLQRRSRSIVHVVHRRDCRRSLESLDGGEIGRGLGNVPSTPSTVYRRRGDGTRKCSLPSPETSRNAFQRDGSNNRPKALGVPERQCFPMPVAQHSRHDEHTPWPGEDAAIRLPDEQHAGACRCS